MFHIALAYVCARQSAPRDTSTVNLLGMYFSEVVRSVQGGKLGIIGLHVQLISAWKSARIRYFALIGEHAPSLITLMFRKDAYLQDP